MKKQSLALLLMTIPFCLKAQANSPDQPMIDYLLNSVEELKKDFIKGKSHNEIIKVTPDEIFNEFDSNELAANKKFKDKIIRIKGKVENVQEDIFGTPFISLKSKKAVFGVRLDLENPKDEKLLNLKKSSTVDMVCYGVDFMIQVPGLKRCYFAEDYAKKATNLILDNISKNMNGKGEYDFASKAEFFLISSYQLNKEQITNYCVKNKKCSVLDIGKNIKECDESKNLKNILTPEQKAKIKKLPIIPNLFEK